MTTATTKTTKPAVRYCRRCIKLVREHDGCCPSCGSRFARSSARWSEAALSRLLTDVQEGSR